MTYLERALGKTLNQLEFNVICTCFWSTEDYCEKHLDEQEKLIYRKMKANGFLDQILIILRNECVFFRPINERSSCQERNIAGDRYLDCYEHWLSEVKKDGK